MRHVTEEDLVLYRYGEALNAAEVESHLEACEGCRREYIALCRVLAAVDTAPVPERGEGYETELWARLRPRIEEIQAARKSRWPGSFGLRFAWVAGAAALVFAAALAVFLRPGSGPVEERGAPGAAGARAVAVEEETLQERVLLAALGEHLDRTEMVLSEIANISGEGPIDISLEQSSASDLVQENRLYRQTAAAAGEGTYATALDEFERVLLEIARGPSMLSSDELSYFRQHLESEATVFKIRVLGSRVREREERVVLAGGTPTVQP